MRKVMQQAAEMQAEMERRRAALAERTFEGTAGGGVITAIVRGDGSLDSVRIDPSVLDPDDPGLVGDLVVAAVNQALGVMAEQAAADLGSIGGLDLGGLLG
jgi:DNA-binding YbaB/EbfC family protein